MFIVWRNWQAQSNYIQLAVYPPQRHVLSPWIWHSMELSPRIHKDKKKNGKVKDCTVVIQTRNTIQMWQVQLFVLAVSASYHQIKKKLVYKNKNVMISKQPTLSDLISFNDHHLFRPFKMTTTAQQNMFVHHSMLAD